MSSFDPKRHQLSAADWQEIARESNAEVGAQFTIIGGVVLGLFAAAAASPVTGLLVAGYFGYKAWQDTQAANRNDSAIDHHGCIAHLLKASDLKDYARQVGAETVATEIEFALENGYRTTQAAIEFLESQGVDVDALMAPQLPATKAKETEAEPQLSNDAAAEAEPPLDFLQSEIEALAAEDATATPEPPASPDSSLPTAAPNLSGHADVKARMLVLLQALTEQGCPIGSLLNHPFVWCWGRSQSGKTSIALLLACARLALGHRVSYFTTDDDYPREMRWQRVEDSPEAYAIAINEIAAKFSIAAKGGLAGQSWIFDELYAAAATHSIKIQPLLTCVLMKGSKTKGGVIGISQIDTSTAHGLKGIDAAWRDERVSIQAIHGETETGG